MSENYSPGPGVSSGNPLSTVLLVSDHSGGYFGFLKLTVYVVVTKRYRLESSPQLCYKSRGIIVRSMFLTTDLRG